MGTLQASGGMAAITRRYRLDVFALLLLPYLALVGRFWGVVDDAFISFRYARNLALGHGLRYNLSEHVPVEGYSNFLWVMISAVFELFRMDVTFWAPLLSVLCGVALLWLVFDVLRRRLEIGLPVACLATLSLGCFPPYAYWSTGGLETMAFSLLVFVTFERLILRRAGVAGVGAGVVGLLLALMRVEGIGWVTVLLILAIISRRIARQRNLRPLLTYVLVIAIGYGLYFAGRYAYYQQPWANTVYAKLGPSVELFWRGGQYVLVFVLTFLTPALIVPGTLFALRRRRLTLGLPVAAMAWAFPAYAIVVTGDYMAMGRFLVPGLAFAAILFGWMSQDLAGTARTRQLALGCAALATIVIGLLPGWNINLIPESVRAKLHFRHNTRIYRSEFEQVEIEAERVAEWTILGLALKDYVAKHAPDEARPSYVVEAIGAVGYYSDLFIYDRNALVSPDATRTQPPPGRQKSPGHDRTVEPEFFLDRQPTVFYARVASEPDKLARACNRALRMSQTAAPEHRLPERYQPDLTRLPDTDSSGNPFYLVTLLRLPEGADWRAAQDGFLRRVRQVQQSNGLRAP